MKTELEKFMDQNGLTEETIMYRYTDPEFLEQIEGTRYKISANENATEMVEDVYGTGHLMMAKNLGQGLTFLLNKEEEFDLPEKKCVQIRLKEVITQGGKIYPDRSSYVSGSYFLTLPEGAVMVELIES